MSSYIAPQNMTRLLVAVLAATLLMFGVTGLLAAPTASAAGTLSTSSSQGSGKASATGSTTVTVKGSGYQSIKKGFGGIYVVFGYLANSSGWKPSQGGTGGKDFYYVADSQSKNNNGYQKFVAYPGSSTADSANGGTITANGTFSTSLVIKGPTFNATTASGGTKKIDCREVQCGVITFGAHGVTNGTNEAFSPISFGTVTGAAKDNSTTQQSQNTSGATRGELNNSTDAGTTTRTTTETQSNTTQDASQTQDEETTTTEAQDGSPEPREAVTSGEATLGLEQQTVIAGRSLGFTGRGFAAGEQVVATLSSGLSAAGPISAGEFGEIAGTVQIPADTVAGTHKLKLTGAGSDNSVEAEFGVMANAEMLAGDTSSDQQPIRWALIAVVVAAALLLILITSSLIAARIHRKNKPTASSTNGAKSGKRATRKRRPATKRRKKVGSKTERRQPSEAQAPVNCYDTDESDPETTTLDRLDESFERENA